MHVLEDEQGWRRENVPEELASDLFDLRPPEPLVEFIDLPRARHVGAEHHGEQRKPRTQVRRTFADPGDQSLGGRRPICVGSWAESGPEQDAEGVVGGVRVVAAAGSLDRDELVRRLAQHYPDTTIAGILNRQGRRSATGQRFTTEVNYFYRLRDDRISAFWLLSDADFDYKALT